MERRGATGRRGLAAGAAVAAVLAGTAKASAQPGELPETEPPLGEVLARLDDELLAVRDRAMLDLAVRRDLTPEQVEEMLRDDSLSPEQRLRLAQVAVALFVRGPRAAMGIQFTGGVRVEPQPGFDSFEVLRSGDQIIEADGLPIIGQDLLRSLILSHAPGETMPLTVLREGEEVGVELVLGSFDDLRNAPPPSESVLLDAWRVRAREAAHGAREAIVPTVDHAAAAATPERDTREWRRVFSTPDAPESLVIGGQARESADLSLAELAAKDAARLQIAAELERGPRDLERQLIAFANQRAALLEQVASLQTMLAQGNLSPLERQSLTMEISTRLARIAESDRQIRALRAVIRENIPGR